MLFVFLAIKMACPTVLGNNNAIAYHANHYILCCLCFMTASEALVPGHDPVLLDRIQMMVFVSNDGVCDKKQKCLCCFGFTIKHLSKESSYWSFNFFKRQFFWRSVHCINNSNVYLSSHFAL